MLAETKRLISHSSIYSVGNIFTKLAAFLLIPLYARKLLPEEYGIVAILELVEILGKTFLTFGIANSILRFLIQFRKEKRDNELVFSSYLFLLISNMIILGLLFSFPTALVANLLSLNPENILYFRYILLVIFSAVSQSVFVAVLQAEEKPFQYVTFTLIAFLLLLGLNIYKVGFRNEGVLGIVESKLYVAALNFIVVNLYLLVRFRPKFSANMLKETLRYGLPFVFVGISLTLLTLADRYLLKILSTMAAVGIYAMAYKFGMILNMVLITPFRQAFYPLMFRWSNEKDTTILYRRFMTYFLFAGFFFFLFLSLFARELLIVFTSPQYVSGYIIVPVITLSYLIFGIRIIIVGVLASEKRTGIIAYSTIAGALLNIGLNFLFIPQWGILGAAWATLISYLFIVATTLIPQQKINYIQWDWNRGLRIVLTGLSLYAISLILSPHNLYLAVAWKTLLLICFPFALYFSGFFHKEELEGLKRIFAKITGVKNN